ncbi:MAG: Lpg1974 family pore-forming outer membrane protein [Legionellaceae bacterium]|nr:Lpg1974 family pore-forming outer membrane protein [Legionellaceae bacterium]
MLSSFKGAFTLVGLLSSSVLYAGSMSDIETHQWRVGGRALLLQPTWDYLNAPLYTINNGVDAFPSSNTRWNWGFMVEGAYLFDVSKDINLNWYHINTSNTLVVNGPIGSAILEVVSPGPTSITNKPAWDAVNLEFAQTVNYGQSLVIRYQGGAEYVRLNLKRTIYAAPNPPQTALMVTQRDYGYNGFGPRAGLDTFYQFEHGLSAYIKAATGLYAGTSKYSMHPTNVPNIQTSRVGSSMNIVPELEAKMGGTFAYSGKYGELDIDGGWLWINYFNSIMDADDDKVHVANFGFQGPYLGLRWTGKGA